MVRVAGVGESAARALASAGDAVTAKRAAAPEPALDRLVSLADAAERLAVSKRTLWRMIARGTLHAIKIGHGRGVVRVRASELARLMAEGTPATW